LKLFEVTFDAFDGLVFRIRVGVQNRRELGVEGCDDLLEDFVGGLAAVLRVRLGGLDSLGLVGFEGLELLPDGGAEVIVSVPLTGSRGLDRVELPVDDRMYGVVTALVYRRCAAEADKSLAELLVGLDTPYERFMCLFDRGSLEVGHGADGEGGLARCNRPEGAHRYTQPPNDF
jgi:hypothetical protein